MSGEIVRPGEGSPFDAVRRVDADGRETWDARDLQRPLGYDKWERFEDAIDRAILSARISGDDRGFSRVREQPRTGGRPRVTYILDRQAAYLVAMNGDVRKPEIAAAQAYFAVRTQQAEVAQTNPTSELDILRRAIDQIEEAQQRAARAEVAAIEAGREATVANARLDAIEGRHDYFAALGWAKLRKFAPTDERTLAALGRIASTVGKQSGMLPGSAPHARHGSVNTWPLEVWDEAVKRMRGAA